MIPEDKAQEHNNNNPIQPGTILHGLQWPEPVEIKLKLEPIPHQIEGGGCDVLRLSLIRSL